MSEKELEAEAKRRGISKEELVKLLGDGMASKAALTLKDRKKQLDELIAGAGG